jgi:hypothetical protein
MVTVPLYFQRPKAEDLDPSRSAGLLPGRWRWPGRQGAASALCPVQEAAAVRWAPLPEWPAV